VLEPWQAWNIACVFGWKHEDTGKRRFRTVYEEVARKNGKTTKLAGIGIIGLCKDDEGGPEIYAAATKREQSRILFDEVCRMIKQSPPLRRRLDVQQNRITNPSNFGKFEPLSADGSTMDGLNPHMPLVDELHAHKTSEVWDVLRSALGARSQPLMWTITTAGFNKNGICYEIRDYSIKVLTGVIDDDAFFANIYTIDEGDDWQDEKVWVKANPNLGVSVSLDYLREMARQAALMPQAKVNFFTKHLNVWVSGDSLWCNIERWKECAASYGLEDLRSAVRVHLGIDLSTVSDLTSIGGVAIFEDGTWRTFGKSYLPEEAVNNGMRKTTIPFKHWEEQGWLTLTPGNVVDYAWIEKDVETLMDLLNVIDIGFDRWNSSQLVNNLMEKGAPMVAFGQGYASMNAPMKEFERRYLSKQIEHNDNPVLTWAMSNLVAEQDPAGNIKPAKNKSTEKIDPAVSVIMAIGRAMAVEDEAEPTPELIIL
jgi:phage terminase large subunit-like protein